MRDILICLKAVLRGKIVMSSDRGELSKMVNEMNSLFET